MAIFRYDIEDINSKENLPQSILKWAENKSNEKDHSSPWYRRGSASILPMQKKMMSRREEELRTFLKSCVESPFPGMGLLLATLLLDVEQILKFLRDAPQLQTEWEAGLRRPKKTIYLQLIALITNSLK